MSRLDARFGASQEKLFQTLVFETLDYKRECNLRRYRLQAKGGKNRERVRPQTPHLLYLRPQVAPNHVVTKGDNPTMNLDRARGLC